MDKHDPSFRPVNSEQGEEKEGDNGEQTLGPTHQLAASTEVPDPLQIDQLEEHGSRKSPPPQASSFSNDGQPNVMSNFRKRGRPNETEATVPAKHGEPLKDHLQNRTTPHTTHFEGNDTAGYSSTELVLSKDQGKQSDLENGITVLDSLVGLFRNMYRSNSGPSERDKKAYHKLTSELRKQIQQGKAEQAQLKLWHSQQLGSLNQEIWRRNEVESQLRKQLATLEHNNSKLLEVCDTFDEKMKALQARSLRHMSDGRWIAQDDSKTHDRLRELRDKIKSWADEFGIRTIQELDYLESEEHNEDKARLKEYLSSVIHGTESEFVPADISRTKVTSMVLTAVLAHSIHEKVIDNPFFFLDEEAANDANPPSSTVRKLYEELIQINTTEAHQWRCQIIRSFSQHSRSTDNKSFTSSKFSIKQHVACSQFTGAFCSGPAKILLHDLQDTEEQVARDQALFDIWFLAGTLSKDLWTQLPYPQCHFLGKLQSEKFNINSPEVEAHRMYKIDDGDTRLNDRDIVMVIYPAVLVFGNVDGERYEKGRVLAKATVWLSSEGRI